MKKRICSLLPLMLLIITMNLHAINPKTLPSDIEKEKKRKEAIESVSKIPSSLDVLPKDIQIIILQSLAGDTLDEALVGIKRFYIASPKSRESIETMEAILSYIMQKFMLVEGKELQEVIDKLKKIESFPVFVKKELNDWIDQQKNRLDNEQTLIKAAHNRDLEKVKDLISKGVNPNVKDRFGNTPLLEVTRRKALSENASQIISLLLNAGADVNAQNSLGVTALFLASKHGLIFAVEKLIEKGANPNIHTASNMTPLDGVSIGMSPDNIDSTELRPNHKKVIQLLLDARADPNAGKKTIKGAIETSNFSHEEKQELINLLKERGLKN